MVLVPLVHSANKYKRLWELSREEEDNDCRSSSLSHTPPRMKLFHGLANLGRYWTADRLARRGLAHPPRCPLCDQASEMIKHLIMECPFSKQVWHAILSWLRLTCRVPAGEDTLMDWWCNARHSTPKPMHKGLASLQRCWSHGWLGSIAMTACSMPRLRQPTFWLTRSRRRLRYGQGPARHYPTDLGCTLNL